MTSSASLPEAPLVRAVDVRKTYALGEQTIDALAGVSFEIQRGEFVAVMGASGSGKSTLMNLIGGLDVPTAGRMEVMGRDLASLGADALAELRNASIGFVFQQFNLLPRTTALRQVLLPLSYNRLKPAANPLARARTCLEAVHLGDRMHHLPSQLSGGQQQRIAIARALVNDPPIILADEPTGALDSRTAAEVMALLQELNANGRTIIVVTHDQSTADYARRLITCRDGRILSDSRLGPAREAA